jgi:hypothetical protein
MAGRSSRHGLVIWSALMAGSIHSVAATELPDSVAAMQREALSRDGAYRLVESLTTEVGARFAGTEGDRRAAEWAVAALRELGFPKVWTEPVTVPRWIRGSAAGEIVSPWPQRVELIALGGSVGTPAGGLEAEVVAVENIDALAGLGDDLIRGRIVFFTQRMRPSSSGAGYGETVPIRSKGAAEAGKRGALAVLIRSVGTDTNRLPHTGSTRYGEEGPKIPAAALSAPDADLLERQVRSGRPVRFRLELDCRREEDVVSANVLGEFPGGELPEEIVLLAAHLDSWDVGTGAQDNGTGVATAMEAARLAATASGRGARRTIRVLLTANEEFGLSGGKAYAANHASEIPAHVAGAESDSGAGRVLSFMTRFAAEDSAAVSELGARLQPLGIPFDAQEAGGGADLSRIRPLGVPLVDLDQDRTRYFDIHHSDNDTLDKVDRGHLRQITAAFATFAEWAANRPERLISRPPDPPEE